VVETGGHDRCPDDAHQLRDFLIDYEIFSTTFPDEHFPKGANWLMLGPSGPRRLRLAVEHLCQHLAASVSARPRSPLGSSS
jgi:hypothetical protein